MATWLDQRYERETGTALYVELLGVWARKGSYSHRIIWESFANYPDPAEWWEERDCSDELKALAIYSLSVNPTTGAAERNWSTHGFLHSKLRNRLTNPRIQKLVYLFQNLLVRDQMLAASPSYFDSEEVEEVSGDELDGIDVVSSDTELISF